MALKRFASAARIFTECVEAFRTLHGLNEVARQKVEHQRETEIRELRDAALRLATDRRRSRDAELAQLELHTNYLKRQQSSATALALGSAYFRNGQLDEAEREWKAAVTADGRFSEAHNNLAALYAMTGRKREAEDAVRSAERSGFRVHPQLKSDIEGLRDPMYQSALSADVR
jgi:Flp pilus assembly protein TadD